MALRGAFQDVSAHYQTQVALAATRDQLADSEQRAAEEHQLAFRLQRAIMPPDLPPAEAAGVDVAVRYRPAESGRLVGGDWYDTLLLPSKDLLLVVGDITGHGIDAVTGMVAARNALRGLAATGASPAELLRHLNYSACHLTEGIAGTVVCGHYDPDTRLLRWARAGHLPPILARAGKAETLPLPGGVLLGLDPYAEYEEASPPAAHRRHAAAVHRRPDRAPRGLDQRRARRFHRGRRRRPPTRPGHPGRPHPVQRGLRHRRRRLPRRDPHPVGTHPWRLPQLQAVNKYDIVFV